MKHVVSRSLICYKHRLNDRNMPQMSHFQALEGSELQISYDTWRPGDDRALGWGFLSRGAQNG